MTTDRRRRTCRLILAVAALAIAAPAYAQGPPPIPPPTPPPPAVPLPLVGPPGNPLNSLPPPTLNHTWPSTRTAPPELSARCGAEPTAELQRNCVGSFHNDLSRPPPRN